MSYPQQQNQRYYGEELSIPSNGIPVESSKATSPVRDGWIYEDNGRLIGGPSAKVWVRYGLIAVHLILLILIMVFSAVFIGDIPLFIIHLAMTVAFVVYIPAALYISISRKRSHYDQAGGEVAYLVVQQLGWLASAIFAGLYDNILGRTCSSSSRLLVNGVYFRVPVFSRACSWIPAIIALSVIHFCFTLAWMIWVIVEARRASPGYRSRGFGIGMGWLLRGWKG